MGRLSSCENGLGIVKTADARIYEIRLSGHEPDPAIYATVRADDQAAMVYAAALLDRYPAYLTVEVWKGTVLIGTLSA